MVSARSAPGATTDRDFQGCVPIHTATKSSDRYPEVYTNIVKKSISREPSIFGPPEYLHVLQSGLVWPCLDFQYNPPLHVLHANQAFARGWVLSSGKPNRPHPNANVNEVECLGS